MAVEKIVHRCMDCDNTWIKRYEEEVCPECGSEMVRTHKWSTWDEDGIEYVRD